MIEERREQIDRLNSQILNLLNKRTEIALEMGKIKAKKGLPVYSPDREREILKKVLEENQGPLLGAAIQRIFKLIIEETRKLEKEVHKNGSGNETGSYREANSRSKR